MYSKTHYRRHPSAFKLIQLLSVHNKKELKISVKVHHHYKLPLIHLKFAKG